MPPKTCAHQVLYHDTCDHARINTSWIRPNEDARLSANTLSGSRPSVLPKHVPKPSSFPGPVVMPDDALALDPDQEPQDLREYVSADYRNRVTPQRNAIYVFDAPAIASDIAYAQAWQDPVVPDGPENESPTAALAARRPLVEDVAEYVRAFYQGMAVRVVKDRFRLVKWTSQKRSAGPDTAKAVGLEASDASGTPSSVTQVRYRPSDDGVAPKGQLNLNDLLDGLLAELPSDAYAAMLLVHHDMYEDEEDDFCCGRAYGASRICVVSTFRYHPKLGAYEGIMADHTWPNSHCREYVDAVWACSLQDSPEGGPDQRRSFDEDRMLKVPKVPKSRLSDQGQPGSPLTEAFLSTRSYPSQRFKCRDWEETWLARACVVAVHELGHCFGLDHCVYYACLMQGTASVAEDTQQPPYLCPVCQSKVAYAVGVEPMPTRGRRRRTLEEVGKMEIKWTLKQYAAVKEYCDGRTGGVMFKGLGAWLQSRIEEIEGMKTGPSEDQHHEPGPAKPGSRSASRFAALVD